MVRFLFIALSISIFASACSNTEESSQIINNLQTQIEELNIQLEESTSNNQSEVLSEMEAELKALETLLKETIGLDIDAIREKKWYKGIKFGLGLLLTTFKGIGTGLYNLYDLITLG